MASYYRKRKSWTVAYRLKGRPREFVYGIRSLAMARQVKHAKDLEEQLSRAGLHTPKPNAAKIEAAELKGIEAHVDDFEKSILNRGKVAAHAHQTAAHVRRLAKLAKITRLSDLDADALQAAAKRLIDDEQLAPRTANAAIKAARQFSTWLYTADRVPADVLHRKLRTYNEATDQRRLRRAPSIEEYTRLLDAARAGRKRCGIKGEDRAVLYQVAVGTGFRMRACLSLSKSSFHVAPTLTAPFVRLAARWNKNRKERDQRIRADVAAMLHEWLKSQPDTGLVWRPSKHAHLELMMRRDLEAARKAWLAEAANDPRELERRQKSSFCLYQDHAGRFADFHALRHLGISLVVRSAGLRAGQVWADHSTPLLTAKYAHMDVTDEERALAGLPAAEARGPAQLAKKSEEERSKTKTKRIG